MKKFMLCKDIIIKAGTIFNCEDGRKSEYVSGNYGTIIGLTDNSSGELIYGIDNIYELKEWFKELKDEN